MKRKKNGIYYFKGDTICKAITMDRYAAMANKARVSVCE